MNRENIVHDVVNATMIATEDAVSVKATLREGRVIGIIVYTDGTHNDSANIINVGFKSANKGYEEEPVHVDNYKHPSNGYTGLRPVNFVAGRAVYAEFTAKDKVSANTAFQVVFIIDQSQQ